jgi:hypothetical protein
LVEKIHLRVSLATTMTFSMRVSAALGKSKRKAGKAMADSADSAWVLTTIL